MKLVFYQSREDTGYVGEATIKRIILSDDPFAFFETFGDAVFLNREEVRAYVENQERWQGTRVRKEKPGKRTWLALELEDIREYEAVKNPSGSSRSGGSISENNSCIPPGMKVTSIVASGDLHHTRSLSNSCRNYYTRGPGCPASLQSFFSASDSSCCQCHPD